MRLLDDHLPAPSATRPARHRRRSRRSVLGAAAGLVTVVGVACGLVVTVSDRGGHRGVVLREEFTTPVATGHFPGPAYRRNWSTYPDGWKDTSGEGTYAPSRTVSVTDGHLDIRVGKDGDEYLGAAVVAEPTYGQRYGRFAVRWRADAAPGYGLAFLLWPDSNSWPADGEIDFPEGRLAGVITAAAHHADPDGGHEAFDTGVSMTGWHTAVIDWTPSAVTFTLDGRVIGRSTTDVPHRPMHWVMQVGTDGAGRPPADSTGVVHADWVHIDAYNG